MKSAAFALSIWCGILLASRDWRSIFIGIAFLLFPKRSLAPLILGIALGAAILLIHLDALSSNAIHQFKNQVVRVEGVVTSDPHQSAARVIGSRLLESKMSFTLRAQLIESGDSSRSIRVPIRVMSAEKVEVVPGEKISLLGRICDTRELDVAAMLVASGDIERVEELDLFHRGIERIRKGLREVARKIGGESGSLLPGLAIGDTTLQSAQFADLMRGAGLSHLTAVSGANFAIVSAFVFTLIGFISPRLRIQIAATATFLVFFIFLVRPTASVMRAAAMASIFLIARASGSRRHGPSALAVAVMVLLLINPFQAFDPGFILSVLATSGLIFLAPVLQVRFSRFVPNWLAEMLAVAAAATIFCTPYLMSFSGKVSSSTILANVLVSPAVPVVTILVFIAALLVVPFPWLSLPLMEIANLGAKWIVAIADRSSAAPVIAASPLIALCLTALILIQIWRRSRIALYAMPALLLIGILPSLIFSNSDWRVAQCDVGQGDALLINLGSGSAALFDAGPDPALLDRCLSQFGVRRLPLIVISHRHADHANGISGIGKREIGQIWVNGEGPVSHDFPEARLIRAGTTATVGELRVEAIWPSDQSLNFESISGDGSLENNQSIVIVAEIGAVRILITGDIEPEVEEILAAKYDLGSMDILKVPHHGSRFQFAGFIKEVSPAISLISVGVNSYGHPDAELIGELASLGSKVYRSDQDGPIAVSWSEDRDRPIFSVRRQGKEWWQISWH